jgi:16S rRNA (cytosine967-C5)-methyltransferase
VNRIPARSLKQQLQYNSDILWDEESRNEASLALLQVLFPNETAKCKPITAEMALKKLLRSRYQTSSKQSKSIDSRQIATLVLGTSVMRLRHWYAVAIKCDNIPPIPQPFDESILSMLPFDNDELLDMMHESFSDAELLSLVNAMVDEHIKYLSMPDFQFSVGKSTNENENAVANLSLEYSMPIFLTEALIRHHGYTITKEIFQQSNIPGPITIRKNAIRFRASDEELCHYLMDVDGMNAEPMGNACRVNSLDTSPNLVPMYPSANGCNRYKVGKVHKEGTITAPSGCISMMDKETQEKSTKKLSTSIWSMKSWQNGYFEVQDAGSQIIVHSLEAKSGDSVLDYCAGNGGKTFGVASILMDGSIQHNSSSSVSTIVAHDVVDERLRQIKGSMSRVGFEQVETLNNLWNMPTFASINSGLGICKICIATSDALEVIKASERFDVVLVDAPCSSSGVLRRRPSQRWSLTEEEVCKSLPELQLQILMEAAAFVKNGGKLVYSTCSLLREENEDVVAAFEDSSVFRDSFERWSFDTSKGGSACSSNEQHTLTILPSANSDGFFIARWKAL